MRGRRAPRGRTVLLSSHILSEVEALCDRVTIIRAGRTVETGTLAELRHLTQITIEAETPDGPRRRAGRAGELPATLERLVHVGVTYLVSRPPTLEELFLRHYAGLVSDPGAARAPARPDDAPGLGARARPGRLVTASSYANLYETQSSRREVVTTLG